MDFVFVFLDAGTKNLYQLRQWIQPLQRMSDKFKIGVLYSSNFADEELWGSGLNAFRVEGQEGIHEFLTTNKPKVLLYPNQNAKNFFALRYRSGIHVWVSHGESDKAYMYQNTLKRYDLYFAAGQAAADRVARNIAGYAPERILFIGRPQINDNLVAPSDYSAPPKTVKSILYAPTWEGVTRATRYSSIDTHGVAMVRALIDAGHQVVYRPHPLSGSRDQAVAKADAEIRALIKSANSSRQKKFKHYVDGSTFGWQLNQLDAMITDVSAVAYDWLVTGKPLIITKPADRRALIDDVALFNTLQPLEVEDVAQLERKLVEATSLAKDSTGPLSQLRDYYYGTAKDYDTSFESALRKTLKLREQYLAGKSFIEPGLFASRGSKLRLLRYLNFALRSGAQLLGLWSAARVKPPKSSQVDQLFTHFSDPFNGRSLGPVAAELWRLSVANNERLVLATNQISSSIFVRCYFAVRSLASLRWRSIRVIPTITAGDSEVVLRRLTPTRVNYLKHHPINLMMLRSNGTEHVLYSPESDPLFEPGHSLIMYDRVITKSAKVREVVDACPKFSQPVVQAF
ncbi:MAG: hypothetical protein RI919_510 [Actinomycetota bacterium]